MDSQLPSKALSCLPCAKRKVRCDRLEPCSHCKRRKRDVCEYPVPTVRVEKTLLDEFSLVKMQEARIEELERHILRASGDPNRLSSGVGPISTTSVATPLPLGHGTKRSFDSALRSDEAMFPSANTGLVKLDKQSAYIEACAYPVKDAF